MRQTNRGIAICGLVVAFTAYGALQGQSKSNTVWDGVFSGEQAKRGALLSSKTCEQCHGTALRGGDSAPSLVGPNFVISWSGMTVAELFDRISKTMPLDKPESLSAEETVDLVAFILNSNQFPAGANALSPSVDFLKKIRIESKLDAK